jgi:alpha-mannosidase
MALHDIVILVPCHSLEDFPSELADGPAESLLNSFCVAWHPVLLATAGTMPRWHRADEPPAPGPGQIFLVSSAVFDWLPHGWVDSAREAGAIVLAEHVERDQWLSALREAVSVAPDLSPERVADFLALGLTWLLVELTTRHMRSFDSVDEVRLQNRAVGAARAFLEHDVETTHLHLAGAFEVLQEARERFYPAECYLLDLCLLHGESAGEPLSAVLSRQAPINVLCTAGDLNQILTTAPEIRETLRAAVDSGRAACVGGERSELPSPLVPLVLWLADLEAGRTTFLEQTGHAPKIWGRRAFGLTNALPQILRHFGYIGALHVVLDDGLYPDFEYTRFRWQGRDGTVLDAASRIPLAADSSSGFLRFPARLAESMDHDQVAGICFARWPELTKPWIDDLIRAASYAPVLGQWATFDHLFQRSASTGRLASYKAGEYISPYLFQSAARRFVDPIDRLTRLHRKSRRLQDGLWCRGLRAWLLSQAVDPSIEADWSAKLVEGLTTAELSDSPELSDELDRFVSDSARGLADLIVGSKGGQPGRLILNPLPHPRRVAVRLNGLKSLPKPEAPILGRQWLDRNEGSALCLVDLPAFGFAYLPDDGQGPSPAAPKTPLADDNGVLRNEKFEVSLSSATGGIAQIRPHNRRANYLSQQISYRFPRERVLPIAHEDDIPTRTAYAEMKAVGRKVLSAGPLMGEIETWGQVIDQTNGASLAEFRQVTRVYLGKPIVEIDLELIERKATDGDPWNNCFVARFAWNDSGAAVTRSVWHGAQGFAGERFDSIDYIEVASESERVTIIPHGLMFHRTSGPRMVDTILATTHDRQTKFRFTIAIDESYPLSAAWDAMSEPLIVPVSGPPSSGAAGWLLAIDARNVQVLRVLPEVRVVDGKQSFRVTLRLLETEGMTRTSHVTPFRQPRAGRKVNAAGENMIELTFDADAVVVSLSPFELADIELDFD